MALHAGGANPSPTLVAPNIGAATGTSLALNGATLGSNTLATGGTVSFATQITSTSTTFRWGISNSHQWQINSGGSLVSSVDNTYDIGASGATRPKDIFAGSSVQAGTYLKSASYTVATLPAAATAGAGARAYVTDANATTYNSVVAAGGANTVPVVSNATNWLIG